MPSPLPLLPFQSLLLSLSHSVHSLWLRALPGTRLPLVLPNSCFSCHSLVRPPSPLLVSLTPLPYSLFSSSSITTPLNRTALSPPPPPLPHFSYTSALSSSILSTAAVSLHSLGPPSLSALTPLLYSIYSLLPTCLSTALIPLSHSSLFLCGLSVILLCLYSLYCLSPLSLLPTPLTTPVTPPISLIPFSSSPC